MGCSSTRENLESRMLALKLRRVEIKKEREERLAELSKITGREVFRRPVIDYLIYPKEEILQERQNLLLLGGGSNNNNNEVKQFQNDLNTPKVIQFKAPMNIHKRFNNSSDEITLIDSTKSAKGIKLKQKGKNQPTAAALHGRKQKLKHKMININSNNNNSKNMSKKSVKYNRHSYDDNMNDNDMNGSRNYMNYYGFNNNGSNNNRINRNSSCLFDKSRSIRASLLGYPQHNEQYIYDNNNINTSGGSGDNSKNIYNMNNCSTSSINMNKRNRNNYVAGYGDGYEDGYNAMLKDRYSNIEDY